MTTEQKRQQLLNIAKGGSGHAGAWIERVIFDAEDGKQPRERYVLHTEEYYNGKERQITGDKYTMQLLSVPEFPEIDDSVDIDAIPVEDYGRHVTLKEQRS